MYPRQNIEMVKYISRDFLKKYLFSCHFNQGSQNKQVVTVDLLKAILSCVNTLDALEDIRR